MDYRYYYDNREDAGRANRDTWRRRALEVVGAGVVATAVAAVGQGIALPEFQALASPGALAVIACLALLRPAARLLRGGAPHLRAVGTS